MNGAEFTEVTAVSKATLPGDPDFLKEIVRASLQEVLEGEMSSALGAEKGERTEGRCGYRSGDDSRPLVARVGKLELRVPQDRHGRFSTELFARDWRSAQARRLDAGGDGRPGRHHPEGPPDYRRALRSRLLGLGDLSGQQHAG